MDVEESERLHSTEEGGELDPRGPGGGKAGVGLTELLEGTTMGTSNPKPVSLRLQQIANLARNLPGAALLTLAHHIDITFLHEAWKRLRKEAAPGIDGVEAADYERDLKGNLEALLNKFKSGLYRAPPVRRVYIPKGDGSKTRPLGIPTVEDRILQKAVAMVLDAVYEQDFLDCSYGFRPGRSAHDALDALWQGTMSMRGGWVIDLDIASFFDELDHGHLRSFLDLRVRDGVLRRAIGKWLNAGVMEDGQHVRSTTGTPQGGCISPLLANVYLHHVLDTWFVQAVQPRLRGPSGMVRYADDVVIVCKHEHDARRVLTVLTKRLERFGLRMHPKKTRLVRFERPRRGDDGSDRPETFDFLGFTHYWGRSRKGRPVVKRKTAKKRFNRTLRTISAWCRENRHRPIRAQQRALNRKLRGHDAYFGITGNAPALQRLRWRVERLWHKWLARRGGRRRLTWALFECLLRRFPLASPRVVQSVLR